MHRYLQDRTGVTIKYLVHTPPAASDQTVKITIAGRTGEQIAAQPRTDAEATALLDKITGLTGVNRPLFGLALRRGLASCRRRKGRGLRPTRLSWAWATSRDESLSPLGTEISDLR